MKAKTATFLAAAGAALSVLGSARATAQAPKRLEDIPVYRGAVRDVAAEREAEEGVTERAYRVAAPVEAVVRFYVERLRAREIRTPAERDAWGDPYVRLAPGETSALIVELEVLDFRSVNHIEGAGSRAGYERARPPYRPGEWLARSHFTWVEHRQDGWWRTFQVAVHDAWKDHPPGDPRYRNSTRIYISVHVEPPLRTVEEQQEAGPGEEAQRAPVSAPTERDLGVPLYPGATFNAEASAGMSSDEEQYFVFLTSDATAKVVAFYETRIGRKGTATENGVLIAVRGEGPFPALGVAIQSNTMFPGPAKTVITIRQQRGGD